MYSSQKVLEIYCEKDFEQIKGHFMNFLYQKVKAACHQPQLFPLPPLPGAQPLPSPNSLHHVG
jgi:hypothetical protein